MIPTGAQDVVAVLSSSFRPLFTNARAVKATVLRGSKAMEHPLETGAVVTDHRIVLPVQIELSLLLTTQDYRAVYQEVRDLFERGELLTVQTRVDSFASMLIEKMPHDETPELLDGVALGLSLKEAQFVTPEFSSTTNTTKTVKKPKDASTVKRGQQQPKETPAAAPRRRSKLFERFVS